MTRNPELHDLFSEWLSTRGSDPAEDPPRDLALHAAGCERCLRSATAVDTLSVIDVGAAIAPPVRVAPAHEPWQVLRVTRYALAGVALVLVAGSVAIGSSWLGSVRPTDSASPQATLGEGVMAGVPSAIARPTQTRTSRPSTSPSEQESPSAAATDAPTDVPVAPTFIIPAPSYQPPPPPPPTASPTVGPTATPAPPTATPIPTAPPTPTPTPPPPTPTATPAPTPTPACSNGVDDDGDLLIDFPEDLGCSGPEDDDEFGP